MLDQALTTPTPKRARGRRGLPILPTQYDLPSGDDEPMESERHREQMCLLINSLHPWLNQHQGGYVSGNMFVYYNVKQVRHNDFKGPDVFVVSGVPHTEHRSWVVWEEGKSLDVVIELLWEPTAKADKEDKKQFYQTQLKVPEYFWFDPFNPGDFTGFRLIHGVYQELQADAQGRLFSRSLGPFLNHWQGLHHNINTTWLRWTTLAGELLLLPDEAAAQRAAAEISQV